MSTFMSVVTIIMSGMASIFSYRYYQLITQSKLHLPKTLYITAHLDLLVVGIYNIVSLFLGIVVLRTPIHPIDTLMQTAVCAVGFVSYWTARKYL